MESLDNRLDKMTLAVEDSDTHWIPRKRRQNY